MFHMSSSSSVTRYHVHLLDYTLRTIFRFRFLDNIEFCTHKKVPAKRSVINILLLFTSNLRLNWSEIPLKKGQTTLVVLVIFYPFGTNGVWVKRNPFFFIIKTQKTQKNISLISQPMDSPRGFAGI